MRAKLNEGLHTRITVENFPSEQSDLVGLIHCTGRVDGGATGTFVMILCHNRREFVNGFKLDITGKNHPLHRKSRDSLQADTNRCEMTKNSSKHMHTENYTGQLINVSFE